MRKGITSSAYITAASFFVLILCLSLIIPDSPKLDEESRVFKVMESLGYDGADHFPDTEIFGVSAKRGQSLIENGFSTKPGGGKTGRQSKHFVCTSCHNLQKEDPDLSVSDPQARLVYTNENGLPFLQGTTLYGAVNRESFYNDDYFKKYGELVNAARNDIRGAIQLCAVECAQGRKLKDWEIESILAYLWTIDLKVADLNLNEDEWQFVEGAFAESAQQDSAINLLKAKYLQGSPAHFGTTELSHNAMKELSGDKDNGQLIYENSCLHCHQDRKYSFFALDDNKLTFKHLAKKADGYGNHSIVQVSRYGVYSKSGKRSYMPQYPMEKMSDQQLADLRAYIDFRAQQ